MRDYYAEFLANDLYLESSENQLTKLTEAPFEVLSDPSVSYVSSLSKEPEKKDIQIQNVERVPEGEIIIAAGQEYLRSGTTTISENDAISAYAAKLELVRADPELTAVFNDICEERIAILKIDGAMVEADAEAYVSKIQFLTTALMMT